MSNKKEMSRAQIIDALSSISIEGLDQGDLKQVMENGCTGLNTLSNKELAADYAELLGETLKDNGYTGIYITGKDLSYYESMERCLHKTITDYFAGAEAHEVKGADTSFLDMTAEHRVIDILLFLKGKNNMH